MNSLKIDLIKFCKPEKIVSNEEYSSKDVYCLGGSVIFFPKEKSLPLAEKWSNIKKAVPCIAPFTVLDKELLAESIIAKTEIERKREGLPTLKLPEEPPVVICSPSITSLGIKLIDFNSGCQTICSDFIQYEEAGRYILHNKPLQAYAIGVSLYKRYCELPKNSACQPFWPYNKDIFEELNYHGFIVSRQAKQKVAEILMKTHPDAFHEIAEDSTLFQNDFALYVRTPRGFVI